MEINFFKKWLIVIFLLYSTATMSNPLKKITDEVGIYVKKVQLLHNAQSEITKTTQLIKKLNNEKQDLLKEAEAKGHTKIKLTSYSIDKGFFQSNTKKRIEDLKYRLDKYQKYQPEMISAQNSRCFNEEELAMKIDFCTSNQNIESQYKEEFAKYHQKDAQLQERGIVVKKEQEISSKITLQEKIKCKHQSNYKKRLEGYMKFPSRKSLENSLSVFWMILGGGTGFFIDKKWLNHWSCAKLYNTHFFRTRSLINKKRIEKFFPKIITGFSILTGSTINLIIAHFFRSHYLFKYK